MASFVSAWDRSGPRDRLGPLGTAGQHSRRELHLQVAFCQLVLRKCARVPCVFQCTRLPRPPVTVTIINT
jgi:hypothetical protein